MGVDAQWFRDAKYGVMIHYLCPNEEKDMSAEDWNKRVDSFDESCLRIVWRSPAQDSVSLR